jgi:hypothetical protein
MAIKPPGCATGRKLTPGVEGAARGRDDHAESLSRRSLGHWTYSRTRF